jgi:hypothetical protein
VWAKIPPISIAHQGCQILLIGTYQNVENSYQSTINYTKWPQNIPNACKIDQRAKNLPTSSIARPYKIYPNLVPLV